MTPDDAPTSVRDERRARLAASLRENLKRRKAQERARATSPDAGDPRPQPAAGAKPQRAADDAEP